MSDRQVYFVWRRQMTDNCRTRWLKTSHSFTARSNGHAQSRLRKMFSGAGFHSMSLVAVPAGIDPNEQSALPSPTQGPT